jgi:hypothetical protein
MIIRNAELIFAIVVVIELSFIFWSKMEQVYYHEEKCGGMPWSVSTQKMRGSGSPFFSNERRCEHNSLRDICSSRIEFHFLKQDGTYYHEEKCGDTHAVSLDSKNERLGFSFFYMREKVSAIQTWIAFTYVMRFVSVMHSPICRV